MSEPRMAGMTRIQEDGKTVSPPVNGEAVLSPDASGAFLTSLLPLLLRPVEFLREPRDLFALFFAFPGGSALRFKVFESREA